MKHKLGILAAILAVALIILPACTKGASSSSLPPLSQILRVNISGEPAQIDPSRASWAVERTVIMQVFQGLLAFNQDLTLKADVAREIPGTGNGGISSDGKTYTFKLRPEVAWSDGKKVTAKDFEYSIKRMLDPELAAKYASFYHNIVGAEAYNGAVKEDAAKRTELKNAVGVKALDDTTLQVSLVEPQPVFLQLMALWPVYPVREDIITANGDKWTEAGTYIGNGPFIMTEWVHQDHITLKPNPNYWGAKPKLTEIQLKMITDANASIAAFKNNELDILTVPAGQERAIMGDATLNQQTIRYNDLSTAGYWFNTKMPPFDSKLVRQAIATAIDRDAFINQVRNGVGKTALSWIPPGMPGHDPALGSQYKFDADRARQLLAQAGYSDPGKLPEIKFHYADSANNKLIAQFLQGQMKDNLGINIILEPMEPKSFAQLMNANTFMWAFLGWGSDYPDPSNWLPELFGTGAGNNKTQYSNSQFDALAKQAMSELDTAKRLKAWGDAQKLVIDDAPLVPVFHRERFVLVSPDVKGMKTTSMDGQVPGDMFFTTVYLGK